MSDFRHAWRAAALFAIGLGIGLLASVDHTQADNFEASLFNPYPTSQLAFPALQFVSLAPIAAPQEVPGHRSPEPFGTEVSALVKGGLQNKWASVKKKLPHERRVFIQCRANAAACPPAAQRFLAIVDKALTRDGWARIAEINRAINLNIRPVDDMTQYGVVDLWTSPLTTFASNAGNCKHYAVAKYVALREIGIADADLRLVVVHLRGTNENHAVAAVRYDGRWMILDNRTLEIRRDVEISEFDPLFVIDRDGVKRMTALAAKPQSPWANVSPVAVVPQLSSGWQNIPLFM